MQNQIEAKPANHRAYIEAAHLLAVIALVVGLPMWLWHDYKTGNAEWLQEASAIQDPWSRYGELDHGLNRWLSSEEREQAAHLREEALEAAVAAHVVPALELVDAQPRWHAPIIDKHPRDPARRDLLLGALRGMWPEIDKMTPHARVRVRLQSRKRFRTACRSDCGAPCCRRWPARRGAESGTRCAR